MIALDFTDFFSENPERFRELVGRLMAEGYVTDENFRVSRCLLESVTQSKFEDVFNRHFPDQPLEIRAASTAFRRYLGEYVYVIYDEAIFNGRAQIESRLRHDGVLDVDDDIFPRCFT